MMYGTRYMAFVYGHGYGMWMAAQVFLKGEISKVRDMCEVAKCR